MSSEMCVDTPRSYIVLSSIIGFVLMVQLVFQFYFFNFQANIYLFGIGWFLFAVGFWMIAVSLKSLGQAGGISDTASISETNQLVTNGLYSVIRDPIYLGAMLLSLAFVLTSQHWFSFICTIIIIPLTIRLISDEEKMNRAKFEDKYVQYMARVPSINFIVGLQKLLYRQRQGDEAS